MFFRIKVLSIVLLLGWNNVSWAQSRLQIDTVNQDKRYKQFKMDGAELYAVVGKDILFIPKVSAYEFETSAALDSIILSQDTNRLYFILRRARKEYYFYLSKENQYTKFRFFRFYFEIVPKATRYYGLISKPAVFYAVICNPPLGSTGRLKIKKNGKLVDVRR